MKWPAMTWRDVLCWGVVLCYFTLPMLYFAGNFGGQQGWWRWDPKGWPNVKNFFDSVTALIFGLAGLHSIDRFTDTKKTPE